MGRWKRAATIPAGLLSLLVFVFLLVSMVVPPTGLAKRGSDDLYDDHHSGRSKTYYAIERRYYGIIQSRPDERWGEWVIGDRVFTAHSKTRFDQSEGPLEIGTCAKVRLRNGRVYEIDSEPMSDCR